MSNITQGQDCKPGCPTGHHNHNHKARHVCGLHRAPRYGSCIAPYSHPHGLTGFFCFFFLHFKACFSHTPSQDSQRKDGNGDLPLAGSLLTWLQRPGWSQALCQSPVWAQGPKTMGNFCCLPSHLPGGAGWGVEPHTQDGTSTKGMFPTCSCCCCVSQPPPRRPRACAKSRASVRKGTRAASRRHAVPSRTPVPYHSPSSCNERTWSLQSTKQISALTFCPSLMGSTMRKSPSGLKSRGTLGLFPLGSPGTCGDTRNGLLPLLIQIFLRNLEGMLTRKRCP